VHGLLGGIAAGQFQRFIDHDGRGRFQLRQFKNPQPEDIQIGHLDGRHGRVKPLVAALSPGAVDGLLERVVVSTPKATGTPDCIEAWAMPFAASLAT
jgi:hypothetical protein